MNYKLIGKNDINDVKITFLTNRGIKNIKSYCNLDESCLCSPNDLENINEAVKMYVDNVQARKKIGLLIDCDCDGFCSAAMIYNYTKQLESDIEITYYLHTGKQHGLTEDIVIDDDIEFLIVPDAGRLCL